MKILTLCMLLKIVAVFAALCCVSCEQELMDYRGNEGVYFAVQHGAGAGFGNDRSWPFQPYSNVEFVKTQHLDSTVHIKVMITGPIKDYDRPFLVEVNPDSTTAMLGLHYAAIPKEVIVPAHKTSATIPVHIFRTPDLQHEEKKIGLRLRPNTFFGLSFPHWNALPELTASSKPIIPTFDASLHSIYINDFMVQPSIWRGSIQAGNRESGRWGAFSRKKIELMCKVMNLSYSDFGSASTMPSVLIALIGDECARYLIKKYAENDPVLEDDGRLMYIGGVPWTSYIGVPWVPER